MKKFKLAIIGQGRSGRDIHGAFLKKEENVYFEVAAVVEADEFRRENALKEYPGCKVYSDYRELFNEKDLDLVVNASFSHMHYPITKDLLEHGFNVLVEKPFARNYYECCDLIRIAKEKGVFLSVFQQTFLAPFFLETQKVIESGKLGDIKQVSIYYNGFGRRWDWQTLQMNMGGSVYNTGPHPIGLALAFLGFSDDAKVAFSKIDLGLTSGDAEDYAKMILTAPGKPVVDVEISSMDAFSTFNLKVQGSRGTLVTTTTDYKMKYIVDGENPDQPVQFETLRDANGFPMYCGDKPIVHEESGNYAGTAFNSGTHSFYKMMYEALAEGKPMEIKNENVAKIINVIETVHAQNPLPVKY